MHTPSRRRFVSAALSAVIASATLLLSIGHVQAADPAHTHLVLGATAGYNYDVLKKAVVPQLEKDGYTVKLIEFNDYIQPNLALAEGSLDANLFQHITYLKRFSEDRKLDLVALVPSTTAPMGIYSDRVAKFSDVKENLRALRHALQIHGIALKLFQPGARPAASGPAGAHHAEGWH